MSCRVHQGFCLVPSFVDACSLQSSRWPESTNGFYGEVFLSGRHGRTGRFNTEHKGGSSVFPQLLVHHQLQLALSAVEPGKPETSISSFESKEQAAASWCHIGDS